MAIQLSAIDKHLYCTGTNFLQSGSNYSITVWLNVVWSTNTTISLVGMYDGTPTATGTPTTGLQIGLRGASTLSCWTYGGNVLVQTGAIMGTYDNAWVMVTYTYDGTTHRLYVNNSLISTAATAIVPGTFTQVFINGYPPTGNTNETASYQVDSYSYYGKTLSLGEITTMYNAGGSRHGITNNLLARYEFDELASGAVVSAVIDQTGNGNTLTPTGASTTNLTYIYNGTYANSNLRPVL